MEKTIRLEEFAQFMLSIAVFSQLEYAWWLYPALLLFPDLSMLGYLLGTRLGAVFYNIFHHKALAIALCAVGFWFNLPYLLLAGIILYGHASMDRMFGYGLKYADNFRHTHLGWIGMKQTRNV